MAAQPSITRIVNRAAVWLGTARHISSMDDGTPLAQAAADVFDFARDELLAEHPWNFAVRRAALSARADYSGDLAGRGWRQAFELPADNLRWLPWSERDDDWRRCEREGAFILTDADGPFYIRYIARVEDPSLWSPGFVAALSAQLALEMAATVTGEDGISNRLANRLREAIAKGKRQDGLETGNRARGAQAGTGWLAARGYGAGGYNGREGQYGPPIVP